MKEKKVLLNLKIQIGEGSDRKHDEFWFVYEKAVKHEDTITEKNKNSTHNKHHTKGKEENNNERGRKYFWAFLLFEEQKVEYEGCCGKHILLLRIFKLFLNQHHRPHRFLIFDHPTSKNRKVARKIKNLFASFKSCCHQQH